MSHPSPASELLGNHLFSWAIVHGDVKLPQGSHDNVYTQLKKEIMAIIIAIIMAGYSPKYLQTMAIWLYSHYIAYIAI